MISHRCRYKARGSVLMRVFTSSSVRWVAARVTLAISSLFSFQSSPPLFYHSTRISIRWPTMTLTSNHEESVMKKDGEVLLYMRERHKGTPQEVAAARAGRSERTGRRYEKAGKLPRQLKRPRTWRTRAN